MTLVGNEFIELSIAVVIALAVIFVARFFKQPLIVAYIIAGIIVSPLFLNLFQNNQTFSSFASFGVSLLLFIVGLNLNPRVVKSVKKAALVTGLGQLIFTFVTGFLIARFLNFTNIESAFIGLALSLSSTIVIMKFLSDKEETETLHGRVVIGFLLIQDLVHIVALITIMMFGSLNAGDSLSSIFFETLIKGATTAVVLLIFSIYILPSITKHIAKSQEVLLLFSIAWALTLAAIFNALNFTAEVGALVAGITLSLSPYKYEITSKMKPFRDFFLLVFFIWLSTQLQSISIKQFLAPIIIFSILVAVISPFVVMALMGYLGYTKRNSFLTGLSIGQISEFSFIIIAIAALEGNISSEILTMTIFIGLITIASSSYFLEHSNKIYLKLSPWLRVLEKKNKKEEHFHKKEYDIILFGHNRIGYALRDSFKKITNSFLVIDNNPEIIQTLSRSNVDCKYGDAEDLEFLSELPLRKTKIIISTIPEFETNIILIEKIREINKDATIVVLSHQIEESLALYNAGATYVIMPHFLGGAHVSHLIETFGFNKEKFENEGKKNIHELKRRKDEGHRNIIHFRG